MDTSKEVEGGGDNTNKQEQRQIIEPSSRPHRKIKSCKGILYYTAFPKSRNRNPRCIGIPQTLKQVSEFVLLGHNTHGETMRDEPGLADFYFSCFGYSVYANAQDVSTGSKLMKKSELPYCYGYRMLTSLQDLEFQARAQSKEDI